MKYLFKSNNLIGDALYISPALRAFIDKSDMNSLQDEIFVQTLPDHVEPLYQGMVRDLVNIKTVFNRPEGEFKFEHVFDVSAAFAICDKEKCHLAQGYAKLLGVNIDTLKPIYIPDTDLLDQAFTDKTTSRLIEEEDSVKQVKDLEGCILISMFSASCESRDKNHPNLPPNKMLPWEKWKPMMKLLRETYPHTPIRFLGAPSDIIPLGYGMDIVRPGEYMLGIPLNRLALIMQKAKLLVTIDNGMSHLAASQETPTFLMYPRCLGPHYILPEGNPNLVWVHMDPVHVNAAQLRHGLQYAIDKFKEVKNAL